MLQQRAQEAQMKEKTGPIDRVIGKRLRRRRDALDMSQETLGARIGVSKPTIHCYETARIRISAGRLLELARALEVPILYFYEKLPGATPSSTFREIERRVVTLSPKTRLAVLQFLKVLAQEEPNK
ncbi:helix-turn-helix transcriptional regulator [Acetobacteraceae bacterium]|nr:helix-turn-helix transcriptional regulator [Candidatus Parcubacteria bacterium]